MMVYLYAKNFKTFEKITDRQGGSPDISFDGVGLGVMNIFMGTCLTRGLSFFPSEARTQMLVVLLLTNILDNDGPIKNQFG